MDFQVQNRCSTQMMSYLILKIVHSIIVLLVMNYFSPYVRLQNQLMKTNNAKDVALPQPQTACKAKNSVMKSINLTIIALFLRNFNVNIYI